MKKPSTYAVHLNADLFRSFFRWVERRRFLSWEESLDQAVTSRVAGAPKPLGSEVCTITFGANNWKALTKLARRNRYASTALFVRRSLELWVAEAVRENEDMLATHRDLLSRGFARTPVRGEDGAVLGYSFTKPGPALTTESAA